MSDSHIITLLREALMLVLVLSAAPMLVSLVVGVAISIVQAATQVQEQTLSYVPKLLAIFLTIAILGPWMLGQAVQFAQSTLDSIVLVH